MCIQKLESSTFMFSIIPLIVRCGFVAVCECTEKGGA